MEPTLPNPLWYAYPQTVIILMFIMMLQLIMMLKHNKTMKKNKEAKNILAP